MVVGWFTYIFNSIELVRGSVLLGLVCQGVDNDNDFKDFIILLLVHPPCAGQALTW